MKLIEDEKIELARYIGCFHAVERQVDILREKVRREFDPWLDELINRNDIELDKEVLEMLPQSYWQFEFRCRIRALAAKDSYEI